MDKFHEGDYIQVIDNDYGPDVPVGSFGTVVYYSRNRHAYAIRLDEPVGYSHGCEGHVEPDYSVWFRDIDIAIASPTSADDEVEDDAVFMVL